MRDLYLSAATREELVLALVQAELLLVMNGEETEVEGVYYDWIGPISKIVAYDSDGDPQFLVYPSYHLNLRILPFLNESQELILSPYILETPSDPYRVWAS